MFYGCKVISSEIGLNQKFSLTIFWSKLFLCLQNHFLENRFEPEIFVKKFLVEIFLWLENHFLGNGLEPNILIENFLVENFLWLQNHFLGNRFEPKIFFKIFLVKLFMVANLFPRKQVRIKNIHQ